MLLCPKATPSHRQSGHPFFHRLFTQTFRYRCSDCAAISPLNSSRGERSVITNQFMVYLLFSIIWPCAFGLLYALAERLFPNVLIPDHVDE